MTCSLLAVSVLIDELAFFQLRFRMNAPVIATLSPLSSPATISTFLPNERRAGPPASRMFPDRFMNENEPLLPVHQHRFVGNKECLVRLDP